MTSPFKHMYKAVFVISFIALAGCTSAQEKELNSETEINDRKMEIAKNYEKCIQKSTTEEEQSKCEAMLKGAEALQ